MENNKVSGNARPIQPDELTVWLASPKEPNDKNFTDWLAEEKDWVREFNIPIRNLFIFEQAGKFPGKLCFIDEDENHILFAMPAIKKVPDAKDIALRLFQLAIAETRARNISRLEAYLDDCNTPYNALKQALAEAGFQVRKNKVIYERSLEDPITLESDKNLTYISIDETGLELVKQLFFQSLKDSLDYSDDLFPASPEQEFNIIWQPMRRKNLTRVAFYETQPVGIILPDLMDDETGTFTYMAILPEFRGKGFGNTLFVDGLKLFKSIGATQYSDSTGITNLPMIKIFEKNGCKKVMNRIEYIYLIQEANNQNNL
jgi:ribosomal protein S18 acetylase RimI-like enzyme